MPFLTNADIEQRKAAGIKMNKLNCGWNLPPEITAIIAERISKFEPKTKAEERNKHILELAFIKDMNATQIARLNDPLIVGMGNRSNGKPLSPSSIWHICVRFCPEVADYRKKTHAGKAQQRRNVLYKKRQKGEICRPHICAACGCKEEIELHHIIPLAFGGTDDYFNLIYLCHDCHMKLHHKIYDNLQFKISDLPIIPNPSIIE